jgi:RNA polymerase sigma factor for flagellar operon FliA
LENEFKEKLAEFIDELDEKERTVISLYYYEELKLKEIAFVLGLTASRVSQIHSKALSKLKKRIESYMNE